jgi:hypothetical protein
MFRQFLFVGSGVLAFLGVLMAPGQVDAQHSRGGSPHGFHSGFQQGFNPRFSGGFFDPRFSRGRFDRFEDRFENRFRFGGFDPRFAGGFVPGFGFTPGFFGPVFP